MNEDSLHIEFEKLTDLIVGTLAGAERAQVETHLDSCPACAAQKMRAEKFIGVMRSDRLEEVPPHILERSFDLFGESKVKKAAPEKSSLMSRIFAVLESETSSLAPAFGLRSGQPELMRQMRLSTGEAEIELLLRQTGETWHIAGQVFADFIGGEAVLRSDSAEFKAEMSDLCEFSLANVPDGIYKLVLIFADTEIEIPEIKIGE